MHTLAASAFADSLLAFRVRARIFQAPVFNSWLITEPPWAPVLPTIAMVGMVVFGLV